MKGRRNVNFCPYPKAKSQIIMGGVIFSDCGHIIYSLEEYKLSSFTSYSRLSKRSDTLVLVLFVCLFLRLRKYYE